MLIESTHEMYSVFFEHSIKRGNRKAKELNNVIVTATIINKTSEIENGNIIYIHAVSNVGDRRINKRTRIY